MSDNPNNHDIPGILEDALAGREEALAARVRSNPGLGAEVRRVRTMLASLREGGFESPSPALVAKLTGIPARVRRQAAIDRVTEGVRRLMGSLVHDTLARPALAGFRGLAASRQIVYDAQIGEVWLNLGEGNADGRRRVRGVFEADAPDATRRGRLAFAADGGTPVHAELEEDGSFAAWLEAGVYEVSLDLGEAVVELGPIEVI